MNALPDKDHAANDRGYELHKMVVMRKIDDWAAYKRSYGVGGSGVPYLAQGSMMGNLIAEQASANRMLKKERKAEKEETTVVCRDCDRIFARSPIRCSCGNTRRANGFRVQKAESITGKKVYASMIPATDRHKNYDAEIRMDHMIEDRLPMDLQKVIYANFLWNGTQEDNAEKLGISVKQFRTNLYRAIDLLVGMFYEEHKPFIDDF